MIKTEIPEVWTQKFMWVRVSVPYVWPCKEVIFQAVLWIRIRRICTRYGLELPDTEPDILDTVRIRILP
jgi:hypothetical protein